MCELVLAGLDLDETGVGLDGVCGTDSPRSNASNRRTKFSISKQLSITVNNPTSALIKALSENLTSSQILLILRDSCAKNPGLTPSKICLALAKGSPPCPREK